MKQSLINIFLVHEKMKHYPRFRIIKHKKTIEKRAYNKLPSVKKIMNYFEQFKQRNKLITEVSLFELPEETKEDGIVLDLWERSSVKLA